jgi:hypothetical protein
MTTADEGASGSVNRWLRPDSVRHMSVTTAMQRLTVAHHDTRCDSTKTSREPGYAQARRRFRRWWQVLGSNQRRRSRRFYRPFALACPYAVRAAVIRPTARFVILPVRHMSVRPGARADEIADRHGRRPRVAASAFP